MDEEILEIIVRLVLTTLAIAVMLGLFAGIVFLTILALI